MYCKAIEGLTFFVTAVSIIQKKKKKKKKKNERNDWANLAYFERLVREYAVQ